ncbi:inner membrane protein YhjD [Mycobacterium sp. SM1]|uniref:inner membrane protein YhjD n=1 Tax=Mycobacterium sp. SM1 TaxID=2816243 RepID=UPI001BCF72F5|nr:inner membrane protein YhjD [Mycobacterium sp. SM1]MBS4728960.1 inner membrane protein YhjD [Mycobacterium sp. SM1]
MSEAAAPGILHRLRARYGWVDHAVRANERYTDCKGNFYAAGLAYYTIFALFPLLMVGFAITGFILSRRLDLLAQIDDKIRSSVSGELGRQLIDLMGLAIASRTSVGVIGLVAAAWAGLGWMANLREALSQMWKQRTRSAGFARTKLSDLAAMTSAVVVTLVTVALTALGDAATMANVLRWLGVHYFPVLGGFLRGASLVMSWVVSWLLFTWVIARLPREAISFKSSIRAGLIAAIGFELFQQVASIYLRLVLRSPAGATFGPVVGLMVFAYITARLVLFATAWAATSPDNLRAAPGCPPDP